MIDPEAPREEQTTTRVSRAPGEQEETTFHSTTPVTTPAFQARQLIWLAAGVVDAILVLDFVFKVIGAGSVGFVAFIANLATALSAPFHGVLATSLSGAGHVAYWPDLAGIVVYSIAAWIVVALVGIAAAPRARQQRSLGNR